MHQEQRQQHSFEDINFKGKNTPSIHAIPDQVVAHPPSDVVGCGSKHGNCIFPRYVETDRQCCQWQQHPPTLEIFPLLAEWASCWVMGGDYIIMHYYVVAAVAISIAVILFFLDKSYCDVIYIKHIMLQHRVKSGSLQNVANTEKHKLN